MILSRKCYRQVVKKLDFYRQQHEEDRQENPNAIPPSWGISLRNMIQRTVRENGERFHKGLADQVLEYLVEKGLLVHYASDYTFPSNEELPTEEEIKARAEALIKKIGVSQ